MKGASVTVVNTELHNKLIAQRIRDVAQAALDCAVYLYSQFPGMYVEKYIDDATVNEGPEIFYDEFWENGGVKTRLLKADARQYIDNLYQGGDTQ